MDYQDRRRRLARRFEDAGVDAMLVTNFVNVTYLTGFTGDDSYLLLTADKAILLSDSRYQQQLEEECPGLELKIRTASSAMADTVAEVAKTTAANRVALEADSVTLALRERLEKASPQVAWGPVSGWVEQLRAIKDADEIAEIRRSITLAERLFAWLRAELRVGCSERMLAAELEYRIRREGGTGCAFAPIVAFGPRAALPHASPTDADAEGQELLLLDWGAKAGLYCSDLTRVLPLRSITPKLEQIHAVVLEAQQKAIQAVRAGAIMKDVDRAARESIAEAGFGDHFGHGLGHGFGLQIHEAPRLSPAESEPLRAGMVITIEPGVYLPQWGGVRIEDDLLVTEDGCEVLTSAPKSLEACLAPLA